MAAKTAEAGGYAPILAALSTMQSNVQGKEKAAAHEFLEKFQKSVGAQIEMARNVLTRCEQPEAWQTTHAILQDSSSPIDARLFAATTLKGKVRARKPTVD